MSSDHRRRQIAKGSIGRSRERPPDLERDRLPAGTERQISKPQQSIDNGNAQINSLIKFQKQEPRYPAHRAPSRCREGRRLRFIRRIESAPDAPGRWALFLAQLGRLVDDEDTVDHLLGAIVEAPAERVRLYLEVNGAR